MKRALAVFWATAFASTALSSPPPGEAALPVFKIAVEEDAVYRVRFEDLAVAGLAAGGLPTASMGLTCAGAPVPIWVEDGGDGAFGPGDHLEFLGRHLAGEVSYLNEDTRYNVYVLRFDETAPARMSGGGSPPTVSRLATGAPQVLRSERHLEQDLLILRLPPPRDGRRDELWYWAKLTHDQREPFKQSLDLEDLEPASGQSVDLNLQFRGWSRPGRKADPGEPDHRVDISLNGVAIASAAWNGTDLHRFEIPGLAPDRLVRGENTLEMRIPRRAADAAGTPLIDVVMLNWIEISYPRSARIGDEQALLRWADSSPPGLLRLEGEPTREAGEVLLFGEGGWRGVARRGAPGGKGEGSEWTADPPPGERSAIVTPATRLASPAAIVRERPSRLVDPGNRADYLMIAHSTLLAAIQPLAELHRARGLTVEVVDVEDVYDEFSHGIVEPRALRAFLDHAYHRWTKPAPRFVLLVGDASWDGKNARAEDSNYADWTYRQGESERFAKVNSTLYPSGAELNRRHLIPTWNHATGEGHSASDNWFVAVDGDDDLPDMAIGRLPVIEPAEVAAIVDKTRRYVVAPEAGPWRRNTLLITNDDASFQGASDSLAQWLAKAGYGDEKIYPAAAEMSNERNTERLVEAFDRGAAIVHFFGHGGRYIWRTGPPDLKKNHDLFGLDDLERLRPSGRLPVVLSMTCYSAPFDHPNADSIGEKLLRLPDRGAVAVLAASWRNSPTVYWGQIVIGELARPGATVGEAVMRAKRQIQEQDFVATYNLLGDPAVAVAQPAGAIELTLANGEGGGIHVGGEVKLSGFRGKVTVDLIDERGETLRSAVLEVVTPRFAADFRTSPEELLAVRAVRAYARDGASGLDAVAGIEFTLNAAKRAALAAAGGPTP